MRIGWVALLCAAWCCASAPALGQGGPVRFDVLRRFDGVARGRPVFDRLSIEDGLSQNAVHALLQDRQGFLWIGTKDGLNRYDGYDFTVYRHDPFDATTLSSSTVSALFEDSRSRLWVGTEGGGLNRLDRAAGSAVRYARSPRLRITALAEDRRGDLWVGTNGGGAYRLRRAQIGNPDADFDRYPAVVGNSRSLSDGRVTSILVDHRGRVWIGTEAGLNRLDANGRGFTRFVPSAGGVGALSDGNVSALAETRAGALWVGTPTGLERLAESSTGVRFAAYPFPRQRRGYGWSTIRRIAEGPAGRLWLATADGLARYDPATDAYDALLHDPSDPHSLGGNVLTAVLWDRTDVLWIGTNGYGLSRYDAKTARFETLRRPPDPLSRQDGFSIRALLEDSRGHLWISAGVLYRYDRRTRELVSFETSSDRLGDFGNTGAWSMIEDREANLWFGTYEGLFRYEPATQRFRQYAHDPTRAGGLREKVVYGVFQDSRGAIWAITEHFLGRLDDAVAGRFASFRHTEQGASEYDDLFPAVHEDRRGFFWMATNTGLVRFDPRNGRVVRFRPDPANSASLSSEQVRSITPDPLEPDRILWLGTAGGGLNRFDMLTGRFARITERDGLPNNVVYAVLPDRGGRLWVSTNRGLARYDPVSGDVRTYDVHDGLQSNEFNSGAYFRGSGGRLFFGGIHGVTSFDPETLADNPHVPPIAITGFRRAGRAEVPGAPGSTLVRPMSATDTLRLSYRDDVFTFEFASLDFSAPTKNLYAYRMEGFDHNWIQAGAQRTATYTNLPPGRYTFRVRGTNNDGLWNEAGTAVTVLIAPPPWRTWWAYIAYLLLLLGAAGALERHRRKRLLLKHRLEIQDLEAEKLRELDRDRQRFFANVSHEFRTPLTLTIGPLDDLKAGFHGQLSEPVAEQVDLARRNAGRVLDLINQILDVARLEAGRMPLRAHEIDLGPFTAALAATFSSAAERKGLTLTVQPPDGSVAVWADPQHLEKVLVNLLSNALKFTPAGGAVRVGVESDTGVARITVRDSGPGIAASELPHVFDRFYRGEGAMQPGTGIGLALAKELVDLHGGALSVTSEAGFGSTFTATLPVGRAHLAPEQIAEEPVAPLPPFAVPDVSLLETPGGDGVPGDVPDATADDVTTVLVVDDNADVRAYVRRHLETAYRVVEAADGREGVERARALLPDLIVADVMMPELDGIGLCRELRSDAETDFIPIVLLTAKASPEDRLEGLQEHCDDYLTKPFDPSELMARVENLIDLRRRLRLRFAVAPAGLHPAPVDASSTDAVFLEKVRDEIERHISDDDFSVERLAGGAGVSRAHLHRRLRELLGMAPSEVIRGMRLERAAGLLAARAGTVSEVAYAVGFKSVAHFSNAFQLHYGCRPSAYAGREVVKS